MFIEYIVALVIAEVGLLFLFSPAIFLFNYLSTANVPSGFEVAVKAFGLVVIGVYIFGLPYIAHKIARRKVMENKTFVTAIIETVSEMRLYCSFMPVIGGWFGEKDEEKG